MALEGSPQLTTARLCRYAVELSAFSFDVEHRKSQLHGNGDCRIWIEAAVMNPTTSHVTLEQLFAWFSDLGFPKQVHTDGASLFISHEFTTKLMEWGIEPTVSPAYHPESNGAAERCVRLVKDALCKNKGGTLSRRIKEILFRYRATPLECGKSPAELLLGWNLRTKLSIVPEAKSQSRAVLQGQVTLGLGTRVWCRDYRKHSPKWVLGTVAKVLGRAVRVIETDQSSQR